MKVQVLKLKRVNSKMSRSQSFRGSLMIPITTLWLMHYYVCRKAGPDIAGKTEFVTGKKFKRESLVYHNKTTSLKHEKCFNVVSEKIHSSTKYLLPHSGINNYVQINTYWRYIVRIMASNILLLASKFIFLTSHGLVETVISILFNFV